VAFIQRAGLACAAVACISVVVFGQAGRGRGAAPAPPSAAATPVTVPGSEWTTYGGNLFSQRYSPLDQINKDNFSKLEVAWQFKTNSLGPTPDNLYQSTPLMVNGLLYSTAGTRRDVVALNPATGEVVWLYSLNEGRRGQVAARNGAGRGLSFWQSADKSDQRILFVAPGYELVALNAKTGVPVPTFGKNGIIDLKADFDRTSTR